MDIRQAKEALRRTFLAYTERDETGTLCIAPVHQRPVYLMGPPGIGKTAILYQLAQELDTNLVCYTMTHHTRQSALGLPRIREKAFGGTTYFATEYTMSEILAAVYDRMEQTGTNTGILFLDEINCVSETLMPAMLQLLQNKQFGTHRIPEGWLIAAAGNPPAYNESARLFDSATMDRVRLLEVSENYAVWRDYAHARMLHPAILVYLELNPEHFFCVEPHAHGRSFVTARGWEDLSQALLSYERLGFPVEDALFGEFLQHDEISASFSAFFRLFSACREKLDLTAVLTGQASDAALELRALRFDGRLAAIEFLLHAIARELSDYRQEAALSGSLMSFLAAVQNSKDALASAKQMLSRREQAMALKKELGVLPGEEEAQERRFSKTVHAHLDAEHTLDALLQAQTERQRAVESACLNLEERLDNALQFVRDTFGPGHELLIFLTQLKALPGIAPFLKASARYAAACAEALPEELEKTL